MRRRVAFYPCSGTDFETPLAILNGSVDEVIFCDIKGATRKIPTGDQYPKASFIAGDVREIVETLPEIYALFYRRDSNGEGGSGVFVLGDSFLPLILSRFNPAGGIIVTDGSNSRGGNFKKMIRRNGLQKHGFKFSPHLDQPYLDSHSLWIISAVPYS